MFTPRLPTMYNIEGLAEEREIESFVLFNINISSLVGR
jgi:hypothetical protein